jgi:hypothetical protein
LARKFWQSITWPPKNSVSYQTPPEFLPAERDMETGRNQAKPQRRSSVRTVVPSLVSYVQSRCHL